jgi:hypothetical protein
MDDPRKPDAYEKGVRFGCGLLCGGVLAFFLGLKELVEFAGGFWAMAIGLALVCGALAVRYGDRFWHAVMEWFRHW